MKYYTTKEGDNLGSIAKKFRLPSWKYLYQINRRTIGDNPDLLKPGTELEIPQWDSTSGDEKIREKGASPFQYTGGLRYAYPWVPFSVTFCKTEPENLVEITSPEHFDDDDDDSTDVTDTTNNTPSSDTTNTPNCIDVSNGRDVEIYSTLTGETFYSGRIEDATELEMLLPDTKDFCIGIKGITLMINGKINRHRDDIANT